MLKNHLEEKALEAGTKQSRQDQLPCWPACFVMCLLQALALETGFLCQPLTVLTKQTRQSVCPINQSIFNEMSMVQSHKEAEYSTTKFGGKV
jgi:hypothetical protein